MKGRVIADVPGDVGLNGVVLKGATREEALRITHVAAALHGVTGRLANAETLAEFRRDFEAVGLLAGEDFVCWLEDLTVRVRPISRPCLLALWPFMPARGDAC